MITGAMAVYIDEAFDSLPEEDKNDLGKLDVNGVPFTKLDIIYAADRRTQAKRMPNGCTKRCVISLYARTGRA